jgi:hypothetical protein
MISFLKRNFIFLLCFLGIHTFAYSMSQKKQHYEFSDINVNLIVSIEGKPMPEQIMPVINFSHKNLVGINFGPHPINVIQNSRWKLKVNLIDKDGQNIDVSTSPYLKFSTTFYMIHLCGQNELCIWPENKGESDRYDLRFGEASVQVDYITPDGQIGFNGIQVNVLPDPNIKPPPAPQPTKHPQGHEAISFQTWEDIKNLKGIAVQEKPKDIVQMVVFFDLNCPSDCGNIKKNNLL